MANKTFLYLTATTAGWQKLTITKSQLLELVELIPPEFYDDPNNPLGNIDYIYIDAALYRGSASLPPQDGIIAYVDDIVINTTTSTCGYHIDHIYIYDTSKSWTPGMLTGGNFYLKSGKVRGYSSDILDNGTNY